MTTILLIVSKVDLVHVAAPALCREGFAIITLKSIFFTTHFRANTQIKHIKSNRENGLVSLLYYENTYIFLNDHNGRLHDEPRDVKLKMVVS